MGSPEPLDPQPDSTPGPSNDGRADWLCGPDEGLEAELERKGHESRQMPAPTLFRPGDRAPAEPPPSVTKKPELTRPAAVPLAPRAPLPTMRAGNLPDDDRAKPVAPLVDEPGMGDDFQRGAMSWAPGANSVPSVRRDAPASRAPEPRQALPQPATPLREFPMDDAEERAKARAEADAAAAFAAEVAARPHAPVAPEAFDVAVEVPMPWWMQVAHLLRNDRKIQILTGLVAVALLLVAFWPRGARPIAMSEVRKHPERYDGKTVKMSGRVTEVFSVGGGYAFYMTSGRDTMVVFTRTRTPERRQHLTITGQMSTGYLYGQPCSALFEDAEPK